jgi:hypothetical protein
METPATATLFVNGIHNDLNKEDLSNVFQSYGEIINVIISEKGFCFVFFVNVEDASKAKQAFESGVDFNLPVRTAERPIAIEFSNKTIETMTIKKSAAELNEEYKEKRREEFKWCVKINGLPSRFFSGRFKEWVNGNSVTGVKTALTLGILEDVVDADANADRNTEENENEMQTEPRKRKITTGFISFETEEDANNAITALDGKSVEAPVRRIADKTDGDDDGIENDNNNDDGNDNGNKTNHVSEMQSFMVTAVRFTEDIPFPERKPRSTNDRRDDRGNNRRPNGQGQGRRDVCRDFASQRGCSRGNACRFDHSGGGGSGRGYNDRYNSNSDRDRYDGGGRYGDNRGSRYDDRNRNDDRNYRPYDRDGGDRYGGGNRRDGDRDRRENNYGTNYGSGRERYDDRRRPYEGDRYENRRDDRRRDYRDQDRNDDGNVNRSSYNSYSTGRADVHAPRRRDSRSRSGSRDR